MKNFLEKNFTRRNFLSTGAKILAGAAVFGLFPESVEAAKEKKERHQRNKVKISVPEIDTFTPFDDLEIGKVYLKFGEMDKRTHTGAIVVHHAGMSRDRDMTVADIHNLHKNGNHWAGIGYHFVIHKDGYIEYGRPLDVMGAHSLSNNEFTVGICLTGNYNLGEPPQEQLLSAEKLIAALCDKFEFPATDTTIFGHRDLCPTSCPGDSLYPLLPEMIKNVQGIL